MHRLRPLARLARPLHTTPHPAAPSRIPIPIPTTATTTRTLQQTLNSPLPITPTCPPPTCPCAPTPTLPTPIDTATPLTNTLPRHHRHLLISSPPSSSSPPHTLWPPRIEHAPAPNLAATLKAVATSHRLRDPFAPTLITNSSFPATATADADTDSAWVLPGNIYLPRIPRTTAAAAALLTHYLLPGGDPASAAAAGVAPGAVVDEVLVLICAHMSRDARCGVVAPALMAQFLAVIRARGLEGRVRVGYTSHLSGHKWAGNVVVYLPPGGAGGRGGLGVWYGRVGTGEVEGIVDETVVGGRVVGELCRGVVGGGVVVAEGEGEGGRGV
ncbi:Sucrase/ferredoxin-like-domain-containing protein [Morchella snyderi]|nr:Sucrase/ferredoxin-like-domain-containing protein [Morchella snyderi]